MRNQMILPAQLISLSPFTIISANAKFHCARPYCCGLTFNNSIMWGGAANSTCMLYRVNCVEGSSHGDCHLVIYMTEEIHIKALHYVAKAFIITNTLKNPLKHVIPFNIVKFHFLLYNKLNAFPLKEKEGNIYRKITVLCSDNLTKLQ